MARTDDGTTADGDHTLAATLAPEGPLGAARTLIADPSLPRPAGDDLEIERGAQVGRYVVLTRLGAGGMGVVYAAYDPELDRKVALKLLLAATGHGHGASTGKTRLLREAQALAKLSHPHVVAVHDVGTLGDRVWLAMEYIDGMTFGTWLEAHKPNWREVLEVMLSVGRGLVAAHGAGLIHRDLKPDNIMVGRDDRVRIMDFGLARASGQQDLPQAADALMLTSIERSALTEKVTQFGAVMGTPAYMAPEQWRGDQADARADQFAFCVTLWEALFGARPFVGDSFAALAAAVLSGEVRPPPRRASIPRWLRRLLLRGLQADPERRFPSMSALLAALAQARVRSRLARLAVGLGVLAVAASAVPLWQHHTRAQRIAACDLAGAEITEVWNDSTRAALGQALHATGVSYADTTFAKAAPWIDRWTAEWSQQRSQICREAEVEFTRSAELHTRAVACLGERREELTGLLAGLEDDAATAVLRAVNAAANLSPLAACADRAALERRPAPPDDPEALARVAAIRRDMVRAQGLLATGRYVKGLEGAELLLAAAEQVGYVPLIVEASLLVGNLAEKATKFDQAEAALTRAYVEGGAIGADDIAVRAAIDLITVKGHGQAKFEAGIDWAHAAEMLVRRLGKTDDVLGAKYDNALAIIHKVNGKYAEALPLYERALQVRTRELGSEHPDVAMLINNIANLHAARGDSDAALPLFRRALATLEQTFGPDHPHVSYILNNFGSTLYIRREFDEAEAMFQRALVIRERINGPDHPEVLDVLGNMALLLTARGAHAEARVLYERVLAAQEKSLDPMHPRLADTLGNFALSLRRSFDLDAALAIEERALAIREASLGPDHIDLAHSLINLGSIHLARRDLDRALAQSRRAVTIREKALDPDSTELIDSLYGLADTLLVRGDLAAAEPILLRVLAVRDRPGDFDQANLAVTLRSLAELRRRQGDLDAARAMATRAIAIWERIAAADNLTDIDYLSTLVTLGEITLDRGQPAEALPPLERALARSPEVPGFALGLAETRFILARALYAAPADAGRDRQRARRLAALAAETYRGAGEHTRRDLALVETWLKRHPL